MLRNLYHVPEGYEQRPLWAFGSGNANGAAVALEAFFRNQQQLPFLIKNICVRMDPGAAQYPTHAAFSMLGPESVTYFAIAGQQFALTAAAVVSRFGYVCDLVLPPRWQVRTNVTFNAGAASNAISLDCLGWYIPRGTLSLP